MWDFLATKHKNLEEGKGRYSSQPAILGIVERSLYYASFIFALPAFIGVWLTLKTVAKSPRWANEPNELAKKKLPENPPGRALFQPFLVGNGLSILFAGAGYLITHLQTKLDHLPKEFQLGAIAAPVGLSIAIYLFSLVPLWGELKWSELKKKIAEQINPFA